MKSTFLKVLLGSVLAMALGLILSWFLADTTKAAPDLPWKIENTPDGSIKVFHIQPGVTRLGEFEHRNRAEAELILFVPRNPESPDSGSISDASVIEAYFDSITIGGIKAKIILSLNVDKQTMDAMYNRGARIRTLDGGARKVNLSSDDASALKNFPISSITYIPSINLDAELILKRFGTPAQKITDSNTGAVHWLYPDKGLDIALSDTNSEVFQYVHPEEFNKIIVPLTQSKTM